MAVPTSERNLRMLAYFLKRYEEPLYQWKLFKAAIYPLSNNPYDRYSKEKKDHLVNKVSPLFTYKFDTEACYEGTTADALENDIDKLVFFGYINRIRYRRPGSKTAHYEYRLTHKGEKLAQRASCCFEDKNQIAALDDVIEYSKHHDPEAMLREYASIWCSNITSKLSNEFSMINGHGKRKSKLPSLNVFSQTRSTDFTNLYILPNTLTDEQMIEELPAALDYFSSKSNNMFRLNHKSSNKDKIVYSLYYNWDNVLMDYGQSQTEYTKTIREFLKNMLKNGNLVIERHGILSLTYPMQVHSDLKWYKSYAKDVLKRMLTKPLWTIKILDLLEQRFVYENEMDYTRLNMDDTIKMDPSEGEITKSREFWPGSSFRNYRKGYAEGITAAFKNTVENKLFNKAEIEFHETGEIDRAQSYLSNNKLMLKTIFSPIEGHQGAMIIHDKYDEKIRQLSSNSISPGVYGLLEEIAAGV